MSKCIPYNNNSQNKEVISNYFIKQIPLANKEVISDYFIKQVPSPIPVPISADIPLPIHIPQLNIENRQQQTIQLYSEQEQPIKYFTNPIYEAQQQTIQLYSEQEQPIKYFTDSVYQTELVPYIQQIQLIDNLIKEQQIENNYPGIDGYGYILMANQEQKQIYNLKKEDLVISFDQNNNMITSKIKYIVKTKINSLILMSYINNIAMSSYHPIQINNSNWIYPKQILNSYNSKIDYLYNIVLENGCGIIVNNLKVITLGYYHTNIRDQTYYANQAFVNDVSENDIRNDGCIMLEYPYILKNKILEVVC